MAAPAKVWQISSYKSGLLKTYLGYVIIRLYCIEMDEGQDKIGGLII